ncbi:MAG: hypothetical protein ACI89Z_000227 [Porticoccus sp.]|jgi:hypothetical protein
MKMKLRQVVIANIPLGFDSTKFEPKEIGRKFLALGLGVDL